MRELLFKVITDKRILIVLIGIAFFWRALVNLDKSEALWECICSGITLFTMGWFFFAYMCSMSLKPTSWPVTNKIYHGLAVSLLVLNIYVAIYYGMKWLGLLSVEVSLPLDSILRDVRYIMFVMFYCAVIGSAKYLKKMHDDYRFLLSRSREREGGMRASLFKVITHERTLIVLIVAAILWRIAINLDNNITFWESMCSALTLITVCWFLFGYICALSVKVKGRLELISFIQGIAIALCAINVYAIFYYGTRWYELIGILMGSVPEIYEPQLLDLVFREVRYVMLVIFYCTAIMLAKYLEKAYENYTVPK